MSLNLTNDEKKRGLSSIAREKIAELEKQIRSTFDADVIREPKLQPDEKARVTQLEAEITDIKPKLEALQAQHTAGAARLKEINSLCNFDGILNGQNLDKLVDEIIHLERVQPIKFDSIVYAMGKLSQNEKEINKIKQAAREREASNGR